MVLSRLLGRRRDTLLFSVVVPTYRRHDYLPGLVESLAAQTFEGFEVLLVDQTPQAWPGAASLPVNMRYHHIDGPGAARARNIGAGLAQGRYLAFTDDDCRPPPDWLANAAAIVRRGRVSCIEGDVRTPPADPSKFRVINNARQKGLFMTANLIVARERFEAAGGFDHRFDKPHFREDTDLGWRLEKLGGIVRAHDVVVNHLVMPHETKWFEGDEAERFFENDALLMLKHPKRYRAFFLHARLDDRGEAYWRPLLNGLKVYSGKLDRFYLTYMPESMRQLAIENGLVSDGVATGPEIPSRRAPFRFRPPKTGGSKPLADFAGGKEKR